MVRVAPSGYGINDCLESFTFFDWLGIHGWVLDYGSIKCSDAFFGGPLEFGAAENNTLRIHRWQ